MSIISVLKNSTICQPLTEQDYRFSRMLFLIEGCTGMAIFALTTGAFLAGFINHLGGNDRFNGIIGSLPVLLGINQLFAPLFLEKLEQRKFLIAILAITYRLLLGCMFLLPLVAGKWIFNPVLVAVIFGVASFLASFFNLAAFNWIVSLAPERLRGRYLALKDALSCVFLTIVTVAMGQMLDFYKLQGKPDRGFSICGLVIIVLAIINFFSLFLAKEPPVPVNGKRIKPWDVLTTPLQDAEFRKIIGFYVLWNFGFHFAAPFFNVYLVTGLKLDYTYIMAIGFLTNTMRVITAPVWGRLTDRNSCELTTKLSLSLLAVSHFLLFWLNKETVHYLYPILAALLGVAWGGVGISIFGLQFNYAPLTGRTVYLAANASLGGITGFCATLLSSVLLGAIGSKNWAPFSFHFGGMQVVFGISGLLLAGCALFVHFYLHEKKLCE